MPPMARFGFISIWPLLLCGSVVLILVWFLTSPNTEPVCKYFVHHLVETNDNEFVADILSVMIGKQHHLLVLQGKDPYKNPWKILNVVVLSSREFSTAFKAVEEPGLYLKFAIDVKSSYKWTNSLLAMPFFSHPMVSASLSPLLSTRSSSCPWLGRPPSLVQLMTTYDLFRTRWKPVPYFSSHLALCRIITRHIQPPHLECLIQKFTWIMYVFWPFSALEFWQ